MTVSQALTVEQLNSYIRDVIASAPLLNHVTVKGEISNLRIYSSGHLYFSLKDENSSLPATMFNGVGKLKFTPENGMKVICTGYVSVYVRDGQYRFYASDIMPDGVGSLAIAFEKLKAKLNAEGLFDQAHKKPIPKYPFRVGLVTAPNGAAVRDMINVTKRRFPAAEIILSPSTVQGPGAPAELISALQLLDSSSLCDVIIIGRGGGSMEDLWCFNDENLARAVFNCNTPIISAVGHEIDFTICDFVADMRAPTPSAAAELAVPDSAELLRKFSNVQTRLTQYLTTTTQYLSHRLSSLSSRPVLANPSVFLDEKKTFLLQVEDRLSRSLDLTLDRKKNSLTLQKEKLMSLNPLSILDRGFSVTLSQDGKVVRNVADLPAGTDFRVRLSDGTVDAVSKNTNKT